MVTRCHLVHIPFAAVTLAAAYVPYREKPNQILHGIYRNKKQVAGERSKYMKKMRRSFMSWLIRIIISVALGSLAALWSVPFAYVERGSYAMGGEWVLILTCVALPFLFQPRL